MSTAPAGPGLLVFAGEETFLVDEAASAAFTAAAAPLQSELSYEKLSSDQAGPEAVETAVGQVPFLDPYRVVMVTDPPGLVAARGRSTARSRKAAAQPDRLLRALLGAADPASTTCCILVLHSAHAAPGPFDGVLGARVRRFAKLRPREMEEWVGTRLRQAGLPRGANPQAVARYLTGAVGPDLARLAVEADKVLAYGAVGKLDAAALEALVPGEDRAGIFDLCDALFLSDPRRRHDLLRRVLEREDPGAVIALLARQVRQWLRARELRDSGFSRAAAAERLGGPAWLAEKAYDRVAGVEVRRLQGALVALADVDWEMKSGTRDSRLGLEALILGL